MDVTFYLMAVLGVLFVVFALYMAYICVKLVFLDVIYFVVNDQIIESHKIYPIQTELN